MSEQAVSEQQDAPGLTADAVAPDCEGCGEPLAGEAFVWSPYEADDGGAYCFACAGRAWAGDVEALARERRRVAALEAELADELGNVRSRRAKELRAAVCHQIDYHLLGAVEYAEKYAPGQPGEEGQGQ